MWSGLFVNFGNHLQQSSLTDSARKVLQDGSVCREHAIWQLTVTNIQPMLFDRANHATEVPQGSQSPVRAASFAETTRVLYCSRVRLLLFSDRRSLSTSSSSLSPRHIQLHL